MGMQIAMAQMPPSSRTASVVGSTSASTARYNTESAKLANLDKFHLRHERRAFLRPGGPSGHAKVLPFQPQFPASTSVKLR